MFQLRTEDRLRSWREFRSSLNLLPLEEALVQTAEFWADAPFVPYNLDPDDLTTWPDPWELLEENVYCDLAKCLGIVYTILLTDHTTELEIRVYKDSKTGHEYNLAWIDQGKYILNMIDGELVNIKQLGDTLKPKRTYTAVDLQLEHYI